MKKSQARTAPACARRIAESLVYGTSEVELHDPACQPYPRRNQPPEEVTLATLGSSSNIGRPRPTRRLGAEHQEQDYKDRADRADVDKQLFPPRFPIGMANSHAAVTGGYEEAAAGLVCGGRPSGRKVGQCDVKAPLIIIGRAR